MDLPITISSRVCKQFLSYTASDGFATRKYVKFSRENFAFQLDVHVFKTSMFSKSLISSSVGGLFKAVVSVVKGLCYNYSQLSSKVA